MQYWHFLEKITNHTLTLNVFNNENQYILAEMIQDIPISALFLAKCGGTASYFDINNLTTDANLYDFNGSTNIYFYIL